MANLITNGQFNNSLVTKTSRFDVNRFSDSNSLYNLFKADSFKTYKGMIALWNQAKLMNTPLLQMTELNNSVIYVNGPQGKFTYSLPYDIGLPYIVEDLTSGIDKPGIDGQKFQIKLNENAFVNTDLITYDLRDGLQLFVTEEEVYQEGNGWVYTVTIPQHPGAKNTYFNKKYLQPGTEFVKVTNVNGEFSTQKSSIFNRTGNMELEVQMGGHRSVYHWITAYADMLKVRDVSGMEHPFNAYSQYTKLSSPRSTLIIGEEKNGKLMNARWMNMIEAMLFAEIKMMEENDLMWSKGGYVYDSGGRPIPVNTGLYEQLRSGNRRVYNTLTLGMIEEAIDSLYQNSGVPFEQRRTQIQVGTRAMTNISKLLALDFRENNPFLVNAGDVKGYLTGDAMNLGFGYRFTTKRFATAGMVEFVYNQALDNRYSRTANGPSADGFGKDSDTLMILDVTNSATSNIAGKATGRETRVQDGFNDGSNIVLIKPEDYGGIYWGYELGTQHPLGSSAMNGMYSSSQRDGYGVWYKGFSSIWLKDQTKAFLMEKDIVE